MQVACGVGTAQHPFPFPACHARCVLSERYPSLRRTIMDLCKFRSISSGKQRHDKLLPVCGQRIRSGIHWRIRYSARSTDNHCSRRISHRCGCSSSRRRQDVGCKLAKRFRSHALVSTCICYAVVFLASVEATSSCAVTPASALWLRVVGEIG